MSALSQNMFNKLKLKLLEWEMKSPTMTGEQIDEQLAGLWTYPAFQSYLNARNEKLKNAITILTHKDIGEGMFHRLQGMLAENRILFEKAKLSFERKQKQVKEKKLST